MKGLIAPFTAGSAVASGTVLTGGFGIYRLNPASANVTVAQEPAWDGTFFDDPVNFPTPTIISDAGTGAMEIQLSGENFYKATGIITSRNQADNTNTKLRFTLNGSPIYTDYEHWIFESGQNNDRDFDGNTIIFPANQGDIIRCEVNSNRGNTLLNSTDGQQWLLELYGAVVP